MEFTLENKSLEAAQNCLDSVNEQSVDIDFTLPDYCPDIEKILKCSLIPQIYNRNLTGGQLTVEGISTARVLYIDAVKKNIRCCEQTVPFTAIFNVKDTPESFIILSETKVEYMNCRALSPRRLVLHGAFSLYAKILAKVSIDCFTPPVESDSTLETFCKNITCCQLNAFCQEQFSVSEEVTVNNKPPIEAILNKKVTASVVDVRIIPGKLMLNSELNLKMLYLSDLDSGEPSQIDYIVPFNKIIDCEGLDEETINSVILQTLSYDVHLKSDMLSDSPVVSIDCKMALSLMGYKKEERSIITDAYSIGFATELEKSPQTLIANVNTVKNTIMHKCVLNLDNQKISKVIDLYNENCSVSTTIKDNEVQINGKANICILALDESSTPIYIERMVDFEHTESFDDEFSSLNLAKAKIKSISYRITNDSEIELRCEISLVIETVKSTNENCVKKISALEEKKIEPPKCALTLYYARKGEKLWDIAKNYNTKLSLLLDENSIDSDELTESSMLLIPSV